MSKHYNKELFEKLFTQEPPKELSGLILAKIMIEQKKRAQLSFAGQSILAGSSCVALYEAGIALWHNITQTGFYEYVSFAFSDPTLLVQYWKEFTLSLVESLPLIALIAFLSAVGMLMWSTARAIKDARIALVTHA
ncbi:MAG: hypothetical protein WCO12_01725 [bacterium]